MRDELLRERFKALRSSEFRRLDAEEHVYLDYTGSGLYSQSQVQKHQDFLANHVLGNPHSENPASAAATELVVGCRRRALDFFGADPEEYTVVFTANASAAIKLVGEAFPFEEGSRYVMLLDNHNSVNGIREYAQAKGAEVEYLPLDSELRQDTSVSLPEAGPRPSLFSFPGQSNFSGVQHPLSLIAEAQAKGYTVLFDAAAYVPTNRLVVDEVRPDFMCVSFYKMFGFPTGLGALIARNEALAALQRPWFAGGTVEYVSVQNRIHQLFAGAEAFEDGTPDFLGIIAVSAGLDFLEGVGMEAIHSHIEKLTARLIGILEAGHHTNGEPLTVIYGPTSGESRGGTVAFNLLDPEGLIVPFGVVERAASAVGISLRGGCFCNPGAAEAAFDLPADEALSCFQSMPRGEFSLKRLAECFTDDVPVGAMRASLGIASNDADLDRLETFLESFVDRPASTPEGAAGA